VVAGFGVLAQEDGGLMKEVCAIFVNECRVCVAPQAKRAVFYTPPPCAPARAPVYGLIHNPPPCAVLEALWVTAEEFHHISPGSVSSLWGSWCKEKHIGAEVEAEALGEAVPGEAEACHSSGNPRCMGPFHAACCAVWGRVGPPPPPPG
jgi:hypothetical protein